MCLSSICDALGSITNTTNTHTKIKSKDTVAVLAISAGWIPVSSGIEAQLLCRFWLGCIAC
jgi:hypothetical protein